MRTCPPPPLPLSPALRRYAWGDPDFIPGLLGLEGGEGPCAEAWFGAHPHAPARVLPHGEPLDAVLAEHRTAYFGAELAARHTELPYLLKLLAAARPLSIQTHPDLHEAREGFAREEAAKIPRDAPHRSYRDANHKPEILVALTDVHAICGFRAGGALLEGLDAAGELSSLVARPPDGDPRHLRSFLEAYFALPDDVVEPAVEALMTRLRAEEAASGFAPDAAEYWALEASRTLFGGGPPDRGVLFVFLLERVHLTRGQALFLAPGVPHAYLRGAGVELMATSDNVLRAGLTRKHVDAAELLRIVRFESGGAVVVEPGEGGTPGEARYRIPGYLLKLLRLTVERGAEVRREVVGPESWLNVSDATVTLRLVSAGEEEPAADGGQGELVLGPGQAALLAHGTRVAVRAHHGARPRDEADPVEGASAPAELYIAGVPAPS